MNSTDNIEYSINNTILNSTFNSTLNQPQDKSSINYTFLFLVFLFFYFINKIKNETENIWEFTNIDKKDCSLDNVIGLNTVKQEIKYYMDFINNKEKYLNWNVKLPKGILLAGPPGTGKTLLIKAIAKELDIPLITASGSQFIEKYVGVGAARVRSLFNKAKEKDKCIIFIDEIDAVGKKRTFDNNSERSSTVNQLLVEMDGFSETENILIFAATNLIKFLDPALTRSGRFDKKIYFDLPNKKERKDMYKLYLKNISLPKDLSFDTLSDRTAGVSGADIANIVNQSKINAIQNNNKENSLTEKDIQKAIDEVIIGREKRERMLTKKERERVSYHEAGHCLMGYLLKYTEQPVKVSIIPRGEAALGFSQQKPTNKKLMIRNEVLSRISVLLGGRCGEKIIYDNVSTGASDDIEKISLLIKNYTLQWGMDKTNGPINPDVMGIIGDNISNKMFDDCKNIVDSIEKQTMNILKKNKDYMIKIAKLLLKKETINYKEIKTVVPKNLCNSCEIKI